MKKLYSTKPNRNAGRVNALSEVTGCALKAINPVAELPIKVAQTINSGFHIFMPGMKPHERALQSIMSILALAQSALLTALLFTEEEDCGETRSDLCKTILVLGLVYQGLLAAGWGPGEIFKDECVAGTVNVNDNTLNVHVTTLHV